MGYSYPLLTFYTDTYKRTIPYTYAIHTSIIACLTISTRYHTHPVVMSTQCMYMCIHPTLYTMHLAPYIIHHT
ncbi:hypothetical protein EON63_17295 [archaeon]|nr:MAG: hypothetical protein EON63_17295 [archaeon]